jgi:hypothetical protein
MADERTACLNGNKLLCGWIFCGWKLCLKYTNINVLEHLASGTETVY